MKLSSTIAAAAMIAVAGCQTVDPVAQEQTLLAEGWQPLDPAAMIATHTDKTHQGTDEEHGPWSVYYSADGSMRGESGKYNDVGTYTISEDGVYCRKWTEWLDAQEGCAKHFQRGDQLTSIGVSGNLKGGNIWTSAEGNPRNL